jgi:carboxymethylenebutenolidase
VAGLVVPPFVSVRGVGETIEFPSNGGATDGYLATPAQTPAPGVVVVQEWWGLVPQIQRTCDRLAEAGFVALAPDLFHGDIAEHTEMDLAAELMNTLPPDRAARDMGAAVDALLANPDVDGDSVGVVGFCMGGMLALVLAAQQGDRVGAVVPFYGAPLGDGAPDWSGLSAPVLGHYAEEDAFFPVDAVLALGEELADLGKDVTFVMYPGLGHAFGNEENALGTYDADATAQAWARTLDFLHARLG